MILYSSFLNFLQLISKSHCLSYCSAAVKRHMTKTIYKGKHLFGCLLIVTEAKFMAIMARSMAADK